MRESKFLQGIEDEARTEGLVQGRRLVLLEILDFRFGSGSSAELAGAVRRLSDPEKLAELQRVATTCRRLGDFRRALTAARSRK